jgi:DNA (cytosine-5)-methyltransferase 1
MSGVYYNEYDKFAAKWLRNLIAAGHIAPGVVDTRSIEDVRPDDLREFDQCHFFAGVGVWSLALRRAGWADDRPVWTGSCPCQPFSQAGEGAGFADERHLWPAFYHLIKERKPAIVLGEQVASKDADPWIDLVHTDMEAMGYAFGSIPFPSAGVGAPHIRDRLYWVANSDDARPQGRSVLRKRAAKRPAGQGGVAGGLADTDGGNASAEREQRSGEQRQQPQDSGAVRLADACGERFEGIGLLVQPGQSRQASAQAGRHGEVGEPGPISGFWRDADWLGCTDGRWRPVEPGTFPLVTGLAAGMGKLSAGQRRLAELAGLDAASLKRAKGYRVGSLRGYGNAINGDAATAWIECVMESL